MSAKKNPSSVKNMAIAVVAVAALAALFMVIMPQNTARGEANERATSARAQAVQFQEKTTQLQKRAGESAEYVSRLQGLVSSFPNAYSQATFLQLLRTSASSSGVTLTEFNSTEPVDPAKIDPTGKIVEQPVAVPATTDGAPMGDVTTDDVAAQQAAAAGAASFPLAQINVTISAEGNRSDIEAFLVRIFTLERPILASAVTVSNGSSKNTVVATIVGSTYLSRPLVVPVFK